ncbi:hypothetical protein ABG768_012154 [Culter alburnus]|uniref:Uncharacterized protein n=1 Tax=Culter alburnus TaxID=194366 RepID=A0AAW1ZC62_CULAL
MIHYTVDLCLLFFFSLPEAIPAPENFEYVSVDTTTILLRWTSPHKLDPRLYKFQVILYKNEEERQSVDVKSNSNETLMVGLLPATEYRATVNTILDDDKQSEPAVLMVYTKPLPPENLQIKHGATSAYLKWTDPITDDKIKHRFRVVCSDEINTIQSFTDKEEENVLSLQPGTKYTFSVYTFFESNDEVHESLPVKLTRCTNVNMESVLMELGLQRHLRDKLTLKSVLELRKPSDALSFRSLSWLFLGKLMMVNSSARIIKCASKSNSETPEQKSINIIKSSTDVFRNQQGINPLDLITALFHCADPFLQQEMALKMSMCQFSVPLLLPNCDTKECTLMLWALRDITKQFRSYSLNEDSLEENSIVLTDLPLISFVRLGKSDLSKSEFLNKLLSNNQQNHDTFVHRKLVNGNIPRKISNGLIEMSWYLPAGAKRNIDIFKEPVAVANLRGDISDFEVQFAFLSQTSSAVFLFCDDLDSNQTFLNSLQLKSTLVLVCTTNSLTLRDSLSHIKLKPHSVIFKDENMNDAEFIVILQKSVAKILADSIKVSIKEMSKVAPDLGITVDENNPIYIKNISEYKVKELPLQGKLWKELSKLEKEMCRLKKAKKQNIEHYKSELKGQIQILRKKQGSNDMREAISHFISGLNEQLYFLKWMKINLYHLTRKHQSKLEEHYMEVCKDLTEDKECLRDLENEIASSTLGIQHFMRELSQLYQSAHFQGNCEYSYLKKLPEICAQLMLTGFPLELIDGDASNIPFKWIRDVLTALNKLTAPHNRIRAVTVLGVQSTGKSTLLNTMFGIQFAVSSGRCTRGAFMLLIGISEEFRSELQCDYILVIDTEGLKSNLEKQIDSYEHDNELATLVVGLSDITIVNIAMENATEMKDTLQIIVHAFLRMKEVGKRPCCHFAHQNTADVGVHEKTMRERKMFLKQLDEMTQAAAKMEKKGNNRTDILEYNIDENNWYIPGLWLGVPPMAPVNTGYSEEVNNFKKGILEVFKATKVPAQDFMEFEEMIRSLWKAVQFENFIFSFRNSLVAEACSKLCVEFNTWEWAFKKHMISWYTKSETKITNMIVMSVRSTDALTIDGMLADLKLEAAAELDKEEIILFDKIEQYFENKEANVYLVENQKENFLNSAQGLRRETVMYLKNKLENAVLLQKGIPKVEIIKQNQRDTMKDKMRNLKKMWDDIVKKYSFTALPRQDVVKETYRLLHSNLEMKSGAVREMLSNIISLDQCGTRPFFAKAETGNISQTFSHYLLPEQRDKRNYLTQLVCERIINNSKTFISCKTRAKSDYVSADIQGLLCLIDKNMENSKGPQISPEIEASLKIHICGIAARAFQKMHDDYIQRTDTFKSLERFKEQCKAEMCAQQCFAPAVMEYIQKSLGPDIVDEILTGKIAVDFSTRSFFQFSLLKQLLQDEDFNNILEYVENYEKFVTEWISERIIEHFSKDDAFHKLEMKHLDVIINKLKEAVRAEKEADIYHSNDVQVRTNIHSFVTKVFRSLNKELVIPTDTLSATLVLNNSNPAEFAECLISAIDKVHQSLKDQLYRENDVREKLTRLSMNRPQEELFNRVFGCGKKKRTEHFVFIHHPQGIGNCRWIQDGKLIPDICSSLVEMSGIRKEYRQFYPDWRIQPDTSIGATDFWKYIFAKYNTKFAVRYNAGPADIPCDWYNISVHQANKSLEDTFLVRTHPKNNA